MPIGIKPSRPRIVGTNRRADRSYWGAILAIAFGVSFCASDAYAQRASEQSQSQTQQDAGEQNAPRGTPYGADYRQRCEQPQSHDDADLCQQWRSANAAELTAEYARRGYVWSIVQSVGLIVTLFLSAVATILSLRALWIAERDLTEREKPVLHIGNIQTNANQAHFSFKFKLRNIGEKAATIESIQLAIRAPRFAPHPLSASRIDEGWAFVADQEGVIEVGGEREVSAARVYAFTDTEWSSLTSEDRAKACFLFGFILYRDQMNHRRRRSICIAAWEYITPERKHVHVYQGRHYDADKRVGSGFSWTDLLSVWWDKRHAKALELREANHGPARLGS